MSPYLTRPIRPHWQALAQIVRDQLKETDHPIGYDRSREAV